MRVAKCKVLPGSALDPSILSWTCFVASHLTKCPPPPSPSLENFKSSYYNYIPGAKRNQEPFFSSCLNAPVLNSSHFYHQTHAPSLKTLTIIIVISPAALQIFTLLLSPFSSSSLAALRSPSLSIPMPATISTASKSSTSSSLGLALARTSWTACTQSLTTTPMSCLLIRSSPP